MKNNIFIIFFFFIIFSAKAQYPSMFQTVNVQICYPYYFMEAGNSNFDCKNKFPNYYIVFGINKYFNKSSLEFGVNIFRTRNYRAELVKPIEYHISNTSSHVITNRIDYSLNYYLSPNILTKLNLYSDTSNGIFIRCGYMGMFPSNYLKKTIYSVDGNIINETLKIRDKKTGHILLFGIEYKRKISNKFYIKPFIQFEYKFKNEEILTGSKFWKIFDDKVSLSAGLSIEYKFVKHSMNF